MKETKQRVRNEVKEESRAWRERETKGVRNIATSGPNRLAMGRWLDCRVATSLSLLLRSLKWRKWVQWQFQPGEIKGSQWPQARLRRVPPKFRFGGVWQNSSMGLVDPDTTIQSGAWLVFWGVPPKNKRHGVGLNKWTGWTVNLQKIGISHASLRHATMTAFVCWLLSGSKLRGTH